MSNGQPWPEWAKSSVSLVVGVVIGVVGLLSYLDGKYAAKDDLTRYAKRSDLVVLESKVEPLMRGGEELRTAVDRLREILSDLRVAVAELARG
jgi:hypothetical protein